MSRNRNLPAKKGEPLTGHIPDSSAGDGGCDATPIILTDTEYRVLSLVTNGDSNKEIAAGIGISPATVKRHIENLLRKLKLRNRVEAAVYGVMIEGYRSAPNRSIRAFEVWRKSQKPE